MTPFTLTLQLPKTRETNTELRQRMADLHAAAVEQQLQALNWPPRQKAALLAALIAARKESDL